MAVTASFDPGSGVLTASGDGLANNVTASRNAGGNILVNGGAVPIQGGTPTVANTSRIDLVGQGGNDTLALDETNGALPAASLFGGAGNDVMTGGSGGDLLFGEADNDTLFGKGGSDLLFGGAGNDVLTGGDGDDQMFGEAGNDRMIWNPGDDSDVMEGGADIDTAEVNGGNGAEIFTATSNGARVRFDRVDPAPFALDIGTTENLVVNMNGGNDTFSATGNLAALISMTVDGGAGNDTILGGNGADRLLGGDDDDFIDGNQGNDVVLLGAGDDVFQWDPGDGNDTVEGGAGSDTMLFNGSAIGEIFDVSASGQRVLFTRNVGNIVMDLNDVERISVHALGGVDTVTVNNLTGTDVTAVDVNLESSFGSNTADGAADTVVVNATAGNNSIIIAGVGTSAAITGLAAQVTISNAAAADNDRLVVNGLGGNDTITAITLPAGVIGVTIDGGAGNDTIRGSQGADVLIGGDGNDLVFGDNGNDVAFLGAGNDTFQWDPGEGNDTVEGQDGTDTLDFFGSNASENIDIAANGGRVLFLRNVANVTMDLDDVDKILFHALGGLDTIVVNDLSGTDVKEVTVDLEGALGTGSDDAQPDLVVVNGTNGNDTINVSSPGGVVTVAGLSAKVLVRHSSATDVLQLQTLAGADVIDASALAASISLSVDSGDNDDTVIGGLGVDLIAGGNGNDMLDGRAGNDTLVGGAGNDIYGVNSGGDTVDEGLGSGIDTVRSSVSFSLVNSATVFGQFENLFLTGSANANATGNAIANLIVGNAGANVLTGGGDFDTLIGDLGNDTYVLEDGTDLVADSGGIDTITSTVTRSLVGYSTIERLVLTGASPIDGTGNGLGNVLVGNGAANVLSGGSGNDTLVGLGGLDTLNGGSGNDTFNLADGPDIVSDSSGVDTIVSTITRSLLSFPTIEKLVLGGTAAINGTGNNLANTLTGNTAANVLSGGNGNDTLNAGNGSDTLNGGLGIDLVSGGNGNDRFVFNTALTGNKDTLLDFNKLGNDAFFLDNAIFSKLALGPLKAANFHLGASAADANDYIVYNKATGGLFYDVNGNGAGGAFQFAVLTNKPVLTISDFFIN